MLKITKTYKDYNDVERTEDFYFNLSEAELLDMEMTTAGSLTEMIEKIVNAKDIPTIAKWFKTIMLKSYGIKSDDGRYFRKSEEITKDFESSPAYSLIYMELASDTDKAIDFINKIVPSTLSERVSKEDINKFVITG